MNGYGVKISVIVEKSERTVLFRFEDLGDANYVCENSMNPCESISSIYFSYNCLAAGPALYGKICMTLSSDEVIWIRFSIALILTKF